MSSDDEKPSGEDEKPSGEDEKVSGGAAAASRTENLSYEQARLAYTIIQALLEHTRVTQDLVAVMAQALDADTQSALVGTPHWAAYLDSRRVLEHTRSDVEKFAEVWTRLAEELEPPQTS